MNLMINFSMKDNQISDSDFDVIKYGLPIYNSTNFII